MSHFIEPSSFAEALQHFINRREYTISQVARLSQVPKRTLTNWTAGYVAKPRQPDDLLRVCRSLQLSPPETKRLFRLAELPAPAGLIADVPFQVGNDLPYFVGRKQEIALIEQAVLQQRAKPIYALVGMAGVGKTALAWRLAHLLRPYFSDGVLWARFDTSTVETILTSFALTFGADVAHLPDLDSKSRVLRTLLATRTVLMILDSAADFDHIAPLIPPTGKSVVLVTSQQRLFGQLQGVERLEIAPLGEESWELLAQFLPLARIEREKSDLARLIRTLGALPLALAIAMSRLAEEPQWTTADYLQHLETNWQHQQAVIDQAFRLTYARLSSAHRQMFRAMGVLGLAAISAEALAYILEIDLEQAITDLNALCRTSLLNYLKPSSYHLHPALWEFARNLDHEQRWQERVVRYYVDFTRQHVLHYARLEAELEQILWALRLAWQRQTYPLLMEGLASLFSYLEDKGLLNRIAPLLEQLYQLLQAQEASALLAPAAYYYSRLLRRQGNWEHAELLARRALQIAETFQDSRILLLAHNSLGIHAHHRGELGAALDHFYQARRVIEAEKLYGYRYANLINTAEILCKLDRLEDAERDLLEVLALTEQEPPENQLTLGMLCSAYLQLFLIARRRQDADTAAAYYQKGLALARSLDHQALEQAFLDAKE